MHCDRFQITINKGEKSLMYNIYTPLGLNLRFGVYGNKTEECAMNGYNFGFEEFLLVYEKPQNKGGNF